MSFIDKTFDIMIFSFMCMFCRSLFILLSLFFGHCVFCPSIYGFWFPLWYLQTLLDSNRKSYIYRTQSKYTRQLTQFQNY